MTIDLNTRLTQLTTEQTEGLQLVHPSSLSTSDLAAPAAARRRRWTALALASTAVAATVIGSLVLFDSPQSVSTSPKAGSAPDVRPSTSPPTTIQSDGVVVGKKLPYLAGSLSEIDQSGVPTLLVVLTDWCPHCKVVADQLTEKGKANQIPAGVDVVVIATGSDPSMQPVFDLDQLRNAGISVVVDAKSDAGTFPMADALHVQTFPTFISLDSTSTVVAVSTGEQGDLQRLMDHAAMSGE